MRDGGRDRSTADAAGGGGAGGALAGAGGVGGGAVGCAGLGEAACVANQASGCEPVFGSTAALPQGERRYAGCRTAGQGAANGSCDNALSCGVSPVSGECWGFTTTCVPDGWIASSDSTRWPADCDEVPSDCPAHCQCRQAQR